LVALGGDWWLSQTRANRDADIHTEFPVVGEMLARAVTAGEDIGAIDPRRPNIPTNQLILQYITAGTDCTPTNAINPTLQSGAVYDICVTAIVQLPGVPSILTGSNNTITGVYTIHIGDLRENR
jgi:hypothetical protein